MFSRFLNCLTPLDVLDSVEVSIRRESNRGLCLPVAAACVGLDVGAMCGQEECWERKKVLKNPTETNTAI